MEDLKKTTNEIETDNSNKVFKKHFTGVVNWSVVAVA